MPDKTVKRITQVSDKQVLLLWYKILRFAKQLLTQADPGLGPPHPPSRLKICNSHFTLFSHLNQIGYI